MEVILKPIAVVYNERIDPIDDNWNEVLSEIRLLDDLPIESLDSIEKYNFLEIIYYFHKADSRNILVGSGYPRENEAWGKVGIFAQRKKDRPNHIGSSIAKLIEKNGRSLFVKRLDAINQTPVFDIKPVMREFLPNEAVIQPEWVSELMMKYW